jgi:hypothetical protein
MNGNGESASASVDGINIFPSEVTAGVGRFNILRFNQASQSNPLSGSINYTLPIVAPPSSLTSRYTLVTPIYGDGGYIDTDAGPNNFEAQLLISPFLANFSIPFANNTRFTSQQVFSTINAAIAAQIAVWGLTSVVVLTLNTALAPAYRTSVSVTGAGVLSLGNYFPPSFSEKYLGIGIAFPSVGPNQTLVSSTNAFQSIAVLDPAQLRWAVLP